MNLGTPARGLAFIRHIQTDEKYAGGQIVIPDQVRDKVAKQQFNVVAVGEPERCEDDEDECRRAHDVIYEMSGCGMGVIGSAEVEFFHRYDLRAGDWVLCRNRSWAATPDPDVFVVKQSDILGKWVED